MARDLARELLERMGVSAEVVAVDNPSTVPPDEEEPPTIFLDIVGRDLGNLIGRRGDHLSHLQYLVSMLVNRHIETYTRVIVDVEGYRSRREESLMGLANLVCDLGATRLGICSEARCDNVFVDTSPNQSRRYCSDRCSSRANVAAFRARQKAASA